MNLTASCSFLTSRTSLLSAKHQVTYVPNLASSSSRTNDEGSVRIMPASGASVASTRMKSIGNPGATSSLIRSAISFNAAKVEPWRPTIRLESAVFAQIRNTNAGPSIRPVTVSWSGTTESLPTSSLTLSTMLCAPRCIVVSSCWCLRRRPRRALRHRLRPSPAPDAPWPRPA